jgi:hypothetical protein
MSYTLDSNAAQYLAKLANVSIEKVLRNCGRDYAWAAMKYTPKSELKTSDSPWWGIFEKDSGRAIFTTISRGKRKGEKVEVKNRVAGATLVRVLHENAFGNRELKPSKWFHKVYVKTGYSKATWAGARKALGVDIDKEYPGASVKSFVITQNAGNETSITITNKGLEFDKWGRGADAVSSRILEDSLAYANERMIKAIIKKMKTEGFN